jgi:D-methionine transport system substrate-binding protein
MFRGNRILSIFVVCLVALSLTLAGCSSKPAAGNEANKAPEKKVVKVGATAVPHAEILEAIKPKLAEKGIDLQIVVFNDYVQPNLATDKGEIDANYFSISLILKPLILIIN